MQKTEQLEVEMGLQVLLLWFGKLTELVNLLKVVERMQSVGT